MFTILTLWLSVAVILSTDLALGAETVENSFEKELYAPVELTKRIKLPNQPSPGLTEVEKKNILEAKQVLVSFFMSFRKLDQDPLDYMTIELRKKYGNRVNFHKAEFRAEAYLSMEIHNFEITKGGKEIEFNFSLTEATEGTICTDQRTLALEKTPQGWKVSRFGREIR